MAQNMGGTRQRRFTTAEGFTLLELLVVVAIIAVLVALAVPQYQNLRTRADVSTAQINMRAMVNALLQYRVDHGTFLPNPGADENNIPGSGFLSEENGDYAPLTSPIAYLSAVPPDPFKNHIFPKDKVNMRWHYGTDPTGTISFVLESVGPDGLPNYPFAAYPGRYDEGNRFTQHKWQVTLPNGVRTSWDASGRHVWQLFMDNQITNTAELRAHFVQGAGAPKDPPIDRAVYHNPFSPLHPKPYDPSNGVRSAGDIAFLP